MTPPQISPEAREAARQEVNERFRETVIAGGATIAPALPSGYHVQLAITTATTADKAEIERLKSENKSDLTFYRSALGKIADEFGISQVVMIGASRESEPQETYADILLRLIKQERDTLRQQLEEARRELDNLTSRIEQLHRENDGLKQRNQIRDDAAYNKDEI